VTHHRLLTIVFLAAFGALLLAGGVMHAAFADHRTEFQKRLDRASCSELATDLDDARAGVWLGNRGAQDRADTIHARMISTGC
jgi:hypothetical protein